ncbi:hypothetical protein CAEBREN_25441 [Caenorhabditis brenneri]|uniref:DUF38 domain-containing protein n=1 Tax=Caenorhabditis brenneri TaxID=135651 RepID=G0PJ65_CAEBE|nr:hypothetical protein CAEBREN_25441 [Caenorhabditis brenneri]
MNRMDNILMAVLSTGGYSLEGETSGMSLEKFFFSKVAEIFEGPGFRLRKVCRNIRNTIDGVKPKLHVNSLSFQLPGATESLKPYTRDTSKSYRRHFMKYHKPRAGCRLKLESEGITRYSIISMNEAETLLRNTKLILDELKVDLFLTIPIERRHIKKKEEAIENFFGTLKSLLKIRGHLLGIKKVELQVHDLSEAAGLLECVDSKSLKTISITIRGNHWIHPEDIIMNLTELEQWKNSEHLNMNGKIDLTLTLVERFASFKSVTLWPDFISIETLDEVKEFFILSLNMKTFTMESYKLEEMKDQLLSYFGEFNSYNEKFATSLGQRFVNQRTWSWRKDVSGSTKNLQIVLKIGRINHIKFSKV